MSTPSDPKQAEASTTKSMVGLRHVRLLLRWEKRLVASFVATALGRSIASLGVVLLIKEFLSGSLSARTSGLAAGVATTFGNAAVLPVLAALLFLAYLGASGFNYHNQVTQQRLVKVLELGMMERIIRHLLTLSVPYFDRQKQGDIVAAVRSDVTNLRVVVLSFAAIVLEGLLCVALLVGAVSLSPWLTLWGLVVLPVALIPIYLLAKLTQARSFSVRKSGYALMDLVVEILGGIRVIKAYRGEATEAQICVDKGRLYFDELIEMVRYRSISQAVLEAMAGLGTVLVVVLGGIEVAHGRLDWPALLAFLTALRSLQGPLNSIHLNFNLVQTSAASVVRIDEILSARPEVVDSRTAQRIDSPPKRIRFEGVGFGYGRGAVLDGISFDIRAGETIGIVGPSGAGKSTLLNLIARYYDPSTGRVLFDDSDLRDIRLEDLYRSIAIVTQEPFLFATTIRENIRFGRPDASEADVEAAARAAYIHEDIATLPQGYDTPVGLAGRGLSLGQKQRITIARALLKNAPLLLLDEATSSLDSIAETEVQRAIDCLMRGRTSFIIAHRLSTLRNADRILVLDRGRLVGFGPHATLEQECQTYRELCRAQKLGDVAQPQLAAMSPFDQLEATS